jgi:hypothetical protein
MTEALRGIFKLVTYRQRHPSLMRLLYRVGRGEGDELKGIHEQNSGKTLIATKKEPSNSEVPSYRADAALPAAYKSCP